jgi:hypothetical protein
MSDTTTASPAVVAAVRILTSVNEWEQCLLYGIDEAKVASQSLYQRTCTSATADVTAIGTSYTDNKRRYLRRYAMLCYGGVKRVNECQSLLIIEMHQLVTAVLNGRLASILSSPIGARVFASMNIPATAADSEVKGASSATDFVTSIQAECKRLFSDESLHTGNLPFIAQWLLYCLIQHFLCCMY